MKKLSVVLAVLATLSGNLAHAQPNGGGAASSAGAATSFNWGLALGSVALFGTIVGVVAAAASSCPSTFSH